MPNWEKPSSDMPSKEAIRRSERETQRREQIYKRESSKVDEYLMNHPSASRAEALYKTRK